MRMQLTLLALLIFDVDVLCGKMFKLAPPEKQRITIFIYILKKLNYSLFSNANWYIILSKISKKYILQFQCPYSPILCPYTPDTMIKDIC